MAMFTVFLDDSGKPDDHDIIAMAGLVSTAEQWGELEREWSATLADAGIGVPFRMADFEARAKEPWKSLSSKKRIDLITKLHETYRHHR